MENIIKFLKNEKIIVKPCAPFGNLEINFLDDLSKMLMSNNRMNYVPNLMAWAMNIICNQHKQ